MQLFVVSVFLITYFLVIRHRHRALFIIYGAALLLVLTGALSPAQAWHSVDFNVLGVFLGTMILSSLFIFSGVPAYISDVLVHHTRRTHVAFLALCGLSGFISSFTENIATVLIVAPLALEVCRRLKIDPTLLLIGISISSNLQGTATLIGDAPSIILATETGMTFNDFFWMQGKPGIFFAVQAGAVGAFGVLYLFYRRFAQPLPSIAEKSRVKSWVPTVLMGLMVANLVLASVLQLESPYVLAVVCLFWGGVGLVWHELRHRESIRLMWDLDWYSLFFLAGIFILVGALTVSGVIDSLAAWLSANTGGDPLVAYIVIIAMSVLVSAFVDNIPYIIAMIPLALTMADTFGVSRFLFLYGMLIGTCLGGNITPIGSASNVVTMGILRQNGFPAHTKEFVKLGLPFTLVAVSLGAAVVWWVWA